jgi:hypothetical protein
VVWCVLGSGCVWVCLLAVLVVTSCCVRVGCLTCCLCCWLDVSWVLEVVDDEASYALVIAEEADYALRGFDELVVEESGHDE